MCELLVRVVDKVNQDFYLNCQCTKRGDVIVIQEDGWKWGTDELSNPDWRIISMPGVPISDVVGLLAPELPVDPKNPSRTLQRRAKKFNLDAIVTTPSVVAVNAGVDAKITTGLADARRVDPVIAAPIAKTDVPSLIIAKPAIPDPVIIGTAPPTVIG